MHVFEEPVGTIVCELGGERDAAHGRLGKKAAPTCKRDESALEHRQKQEKEQRSRG